MVIVGAEVGFEVRVGLHPRAIALQIHLLILDRAPQSLDEDVVQRPRPLPSIEIFTPRASNGCVNSAEVNWQPWSVLKISGTRWSAMARSTVWTQNRASRVLDSSQARTVRLYQLITAHRYM
jgi:hypothetical protein